MPIGRTFSIEHIVPQFVMMTGIVVFSAGGEVDSDVGGRMGLEVVRTGLGLYSLTFNDGPTPGLTVPILRQVTRNVVDPHMAIQLIDVTQILPGSTGFDFAYRGVDGVLTEPLEDSAITYSIMRGNSSAAYR